ncbi:hypothetical protein [Halalkalicoccus tibetensis]|uniref:Uncharacterized protein n=1 Tax=Halalkalicoccus tibetensis TaxID=175632 RepID=A0ABD5V011_9EURY
MDSQQPGPNDRSATERPETVATEGSDAADLADELGRVQLRSIDGRRLRARIESVVDRGGTIRLWYRLPHDAYASEEFEKPMPWSDRFKFARVIEDLGYSPSSLAGIEGEEVVLGRVGGEWRVEDPERRFEEPLGAGSLGAAGPVAVLGFAITVLYLVLLFVTTAGAMDLVGALAVAAMLCSLALLVAYSW